MKKKYIFLTIAIIILLLSGFFMLKGKLLYKNFIKLNSSELLEKINNKDIFILCVSRVNCSHCQSYKPKLKKITRDYDIKIYYTDIDTYSDEEYDHFKEIISFDGATPTTIFIKEGIEKTTATRIEGDVSLEKILEKIKQNGFINE